MDWFVYLALCNDGTYYCGIAKDVPKRIRQHNQGQKGARYTRTRRPVVLAYVEGPYSHAEASRRECSVKKMKRREKEAMAKKERPE